MTNIPVNVRNRELYKAYLNLLNKTLSNYDHIFGEMWKLKESKKNFAFNPLLKSLTDNIPMNESGFGSTLNILSDKDDLLLYEVVDFVVDGLCEQLEDLGEYKECIKIMDSDPTIKTQVNSYTRISGSLQFMRHWTYISHLLKRMFFQYLIDHEVDINLFNGLISDLECFFYNELLDMVDISPLHYFQPVSVAIPVKLSDELSIRKFTDRERIKLWNKLTGSELNRGFSRIKMSFCISSVNGTKIKSHRYVIKADKTDIQEKADNINAYTQCQPWVWCSLNS